MSKSGSWINNHLFTYTPYYVAEDKENDADYQAGLMTILWATVAAAAVAAAVCFQRSSSHAHSSTFPPRFTIPN